MRRFLQISFLILMVSVFAFSPKIIHAQSTPPETQKSPPPTFNPALCKGKTDGECAPPEHKVTCDGEHSVQTALGCIHTDFTSFTTDLLRLGTGAGGGIALLLMVFSALRLMMSGGNPETVKKAREQFVAAAIGLVFIILSVTIMQIIGVDILQIPGLTD
jgi:hypothetical protein